MKKRGCCFFFLTGIVRLLDLLRVGSNLWLNPADDSLADLRIFQRLKCRCLDFSKPYETSKTLDPFHSSPDTRDGHKLLEHPGKFPVIDNLLNVAY